MANPVRPADWFDTIGGLLREVTDIDQIAKEHHTAANLAELQELRGTVIAFLERLATEHGIGGLPDILSARGKALQTQYAAGGEVDATAAAEQTGEGGHEKLNLPCWVEEIGATTRDVAVGLGDAGNRSASFGEVVAVSVPLLSAHASEQVTPSTTSNPEAPARRPTNKANSSRYASHSPKLAAEGDGKERSNHLVTASVPPLPPVPVSASEVIGTTTINPQTPTRQSTSKTNAKTGKNSGRYYPYLPVAARDEEEISSRSGEVVLVRSPSSASVPVATPEATPSTNREPSSVPTSDIPARKLSSKAEPKKGKYFNRYTPYPSKPVAPVAPVAPANPSPWRTLKDSNSRVYHHTLFFTLENSSVARNSRAQTKHWEMTCTQMAKNSTTLIDIVRKKKQHVENWDESDEVCWIYQKASVAKVFTKYDRIIYFDKLLTLEAKKKGATEILGWTADEQMSAIDTLVTYVVSDKEVRGVKIVSGRYKAKKMGLFLGATQEYQEALQRVILF